MPPSIALRLKISSLAFQALISSLKPQISPFKLPIGILRPYISLLRTQFRLLNAFSQPFIASHPLLQVGQTKVPLCSTGLCPLRGRCPASPHSNSQSLKAGQRVLLTTYCPWVTGFYFNKSGQIHGYPSCVLVGRGSNK